MNRIKYLSNHIQQIILSYSYNIQSKQLLDNIKTYSLTKDYIIDYYSELIQYYYLSNDFNEQECFEWIVNDIYWFMNNYKPLIHEYNEKLFKIMFRRFKFKKKTKKNYNKDLKQLINKYDKLPINVHFNLLWSKLKVKERYNFIREVENPYNTFIGKTNTQAPIIPF